MRPDRYCGAIPADGVASPKILVEAGLLDRTQRGKWAYYRLVPAALDALGGVFVVRCRCG